MTESRPAWNRPALSALISADDAEGKTFPYVRETITSPSFSGPS